MTQSTETQTPIECGSCSAANARSDQFCSGCGKSLWEKCSGCSAMAVIGAKFCNQCGNNLTEAFESRLSSLKESVDRARALADKGSFREAIRLAEKLVSPADYRFEELCESVRKDQAEYEQQLAHWETIVSTLPEEVAELVAKTQFDLAAAKLREVPEKMLTDELAEILSSCEQKLDQNNSSRSELKQALAQKDWSSALHYVDVLLGIYPQNEQYRNLLPQLIDKIWKQARKLKLAGKHADALKLLNDIPLDSQTQQLRDEIAELEELVQLRRIIATEPFATPVLGVLLDKVVQLAPADEKVTNVARGFAKRRGARPSKPFHLYPGWMKSKPGVLQDPIAPAGLPTTTPGARPPALAKNMGRFFSAYGLGLFGLGVGGENCNFLDSKQGGLLSRLSRKKPLAHETVWGIDIGDSNIKALKLSRKDEQVVIQDAFLSPIDVEGSDKGRRKLALSTMYRALERVLTEDLIGDTPVITNLPGCDLLARYIELPADSPKQHATFIDQEVSANIPIRSDLLATTHLKFPPQNEDSVSLRTMVMALKRSDIEARQSMFSKLGRNLVAMVAEPFALANSLSHFDLMETTTENERATIVIDVGHVQTLILACTNSGGWFRLVDWGLEDITVALARELKLGRADAERLRRNPSASSSIYATLRTMDSACSVPRREIVRSLRAAQEQLGNFEIGRAIITGGAAHQALMHSMLNNTLITE